MKNIIANKINLYFKGMHIKLSVLETVNYVLKQIPAN